MKQGLKALWLIPIALTAFLIWRVGEEYGADAHDCNALALFGASIVAIVVRVFPMPAIVLMALAAGTALRILTIEEALRGYADPIAWLILSTFMLGRAFVVTGLGRRIGLWCICSFGGNTLGLGYAIACLDCLLAPTTASNTARAVGIVLPIARGTGNSLAAANISGSKSIGAYVVMTAFQTNLITSSLFLTGSAINLLTTGMAKRICGFEFTWWFWLKASFVPSAISMVVVPYLLFRIMRPAELRGSIARENARKDLRNLGPMSTAECRLIGICLSLAIFWATSSLHKVQATTGALAAVALVQILAVANVGEMCDEQGFATFLWFGGLLSLVDAWTRGSLVLMVMRKIEVLLPKGHWLAALIALAVVYYYLHYCFASLTVQCVAFYPAFLGMALAFGAPARVAALLLGHFSCLYSSTTYYGSAAAPLFLASGYLDEDTWCKCGFFVSLAHIAIWLTSGLIWWKLLGLW
jgi:divalent anion:Na+ symporter, DASS family